MTGPERPRRSRTAWPGPVSVAGLGLGHQHDLPRALVQRIRQQTWAVIVLGVCILAVGVLLMLLIAERGEQRDRQYCDLLDTLPEGGLLDRPRAVYDCGPGIPFDSLTPEEQRRITGGTASPVPPPPAPLRIPSDSNQFRVTPDRAP